MLTLAQRLRRLDDPATFAELGTGLSLPAAGPVDGAPGQDGPAGTSAGDDAGLDAVLRAPGFARLPSVVDREYAARLARALDVLASAGLPPTFVLVFDEPWRVLDALVARLARALGPLEPLADAWAFRVEPGRSGWAPHRGLEVPIGDATGAPTVIDTWVALTDARRDESCMWFVAKADDPGFPDGLALSPPRSLPSAAHPVEVSAGDAVVWDANVLHAGGPHREDAPSARASLSFTVRRPGALAAFPALEVPRTLRARLDRIAADVSTYGGLDGISGELRAWAEVTRGLAALRR